MRLYAGTVRVLGRTRAFGWAAPRVLPPIDLLFRRRRRSVTSLGTGFPLCYLTTVGRRSGRERTVPLLYVAGERGRIALIGSNWGKPAPPAWALNLEARQHAIVTIEGVSTPMRARRATTVECEMLWPRALAVWPGYERYRRLAGRQIPVFVLDPEPPAQPAPS